MKYFSERFNKRFLKNAVKAVTFVLILAVLLCGFSQILMPKTNKDMRDKSANGFLGEMPNSIDVLIVGDSESYSSVIPLQMWHEHGITSYVCGTPSQTLDYSFDFLQRALEEQSPKFVVFETNAIFRPFSVKSIILTNADKVFPIYRYHDRWKKLSLRDFSFNVNNDYVENDKGYRIEIGVDAADSKNYMKPSAEKNTVRKKNRFYLNKIAALCNEKGTELIFMSMPSTRNWNSQKHNAVEEISKEMNIEFIDLNVMNKEVPIDWTKDTKDKGDHLNYSGACKVTKYLGTFFAAKNVFEDHRQDESYNDWNKAYDTFITNYEKRMKAKRK